MTSAVIQINGISIITFVIDVDSPGLLVTAFAVFDYNVLKCSVYSCPFSEISSVNVQIIGNLFVVFDDRLSVYSGQ